MGIAAARTADIAAAAAVHKAVARTAAEAVVAHILAVRRIVAGAARAGARHKLRAAAAVAHMAVEGVVARIPAVRRMVGEVAGPRTAGEMAHRRVGGQEEEHRTVEAAAVVVRNPGGVVGSIGPERAAARHTAGGEAAAGSSLLAEEGVLVRSAMTSSSSRRTVSLATHGRRAVGKTFRRTAFDDTRLFGRWFWKVKSPDSRRREIVC